MRRASTAPVAALALVLGACTAAPADRAEGAAPVRPSVARTTLVALAEGERLSAEARVAVRAWNEAAGDFLAPYLDSSVGVEEFVARGRIAYVQLVSAHEDLQDVLPAIADLVRPSALELADVLDDLAANYTDKLDAIGALLAAVENGDVDGELAAAAEVDAVAAEARAVNRRMLEAMEDVDPSAPEVADLRAVLERLGG